MRQIRPIFHPRQLEIASNIDINQVQKPFKINGEWEYRAINPWTFKRVISGNQNQNGNPSHTLGNQHTATGILEQGSFLLRKDIRSKAQKEAEVFLLEQKRFNERQEKEAKKKMTAPRMLRGTSLETLSDRRKQNVIPLNPTDPHSPQSVTSGISGLRTPP